MKAEAGQEDLFQCPLICVQFLLPVNTVIRKRSFPEFMTPIAADCSKEQPLSDCQPDKAQDELPACTSA